ncbi:MAG: TRAP transporter TatT component family protein [Spirochaetaceae bacterium]|nr:TRAP transporter TatT component family protein [Spirochaetaceae bacterium]
MDYFKKNFVIFVIIFVIFVTPSCSINKMAVNAISNTLGEAGMRAFSKDDDPQLVREAFPFALKLMEIMVESDPRNHEVKAATGQLFIIYSNLFVQTPASMLDYTEWRRQAEMYARAKSLYMRGSNYLRESLEIKYRIKIDLTDPKTVEFNYRKGDVTTLYWLGAGLMSAISIDVTDPFFAPLRDAAIRIMYIAYGLDPDYSDGALHEFFLLYYASMPEGMGGSLEKAKYHYARTVELSQGRRISPHIAYATTISTQNQTEEGVAEFKKMLEKAISFDINKYPENRLENTINRERAIWLLENIENYFLID